MANMKATIIEEKWDQEGNFVGTVLVENLAETWTSGGCQVFFEAPPTGHTKPTLKAAMAKYAADHEAQCAAYLAKVKPPKNVDTIDAVRDNGNEVPISAEGLRLRAERIKPAGV